MDKKQLIAKWQKVLGFILEPIPRDWQVYNSYHDLYCCKVCGWMMQNGPREACDSCPAGPHNTSLARHWWKQACGWRVRCWNPVCPNCAEQQKRNFKW